MANAHVVPDTLIWTRSGLKKIRKIKAGEQVLTHNQNWVSVEKIVKSKINEEVLLMRTEHGLMEVTKDTSVRVVSLQKRSRNMPEWQVAGKLEKGDMVQAFTVSIDSENSASPGGSRVLKIVQKKLNAICYGLDVGEDNSYMTEAAVVCGPAVEDG